MHEAVLISTDLDQHIEWLRERAALGLESLDLHNVGLNQREFLDAFGRRVLPALRRTTSTRGADTSATTTDGANTSRAT